MNINYKETQFDFLQNTALSSHDPRGPRVLSAQIMLSAENLVILTIASIMVMIFCFSVGVERGKRIVLSDENKVLVQESKSAKDAVQTVPSAGKDDDIVPDVDDRKGLFDGLMAAFKKRPAEVEDAAEEQPVAPIAAKTVVSETKEIAKKAVAAEPAKAASGNTPYTVQVASYKTTKTAQREADNLKSKGYKNVYVVSKGAYVIVCVGNFSKKSDASAYTQKLKNRYQDTVVRRL